jgi:hypothetical protein
MNMTMVESGNGFVVQGDFLVRMHKFRPPKGDYYHMAKLPHRDFAQVGIVTTIKKNDTAKYKLFEIYTGNEKLYEYIRKMFTDTAKALDCPARSEDWRPNDAA